MGPSKGCRGGGGQQGGAGDPGHRWAGGAGGVGSGAAGGGAGGHGHHTMDTGSWAAKGMKKTCFVLHLYWVFKSLSILFLAIGKGGKTVACF